MVNRIGRCIHIHVADEVRSNDRFRKCSGRTAPVALACCAHRSRSAPACSSANGGASTVSRRFESELICALRCASSAANAAFADSLLSSPCSAAAVPADAVPPCTRLRSAGRIHGTRYTLHGVRWQEDAQATCTCSRHQRAQWLDTLVDSACSSCCGSSSSSASILATAFSSLPFLSPPSRALRVFFIEEATSVFLAAG